MPICSLCDSSVTLNKMMYGQVRKVKTVTLKQNVPILANM